MIPEKGRDYDCAEPGILCNADKAGARIVTIKLGAGLPDIRVLVHPGTEAKQVAVNYAKEKGL